MKGEDKLMEGELRDFLSNNSIQCICFLLFDLFLFLFFFVFLPECQNIFKGTCLTNGELHEFSKFQSQVYWILVDLAIA